MAGDLADKIKRYFGFSKQEKRWLLISILAIGIIVGFDDGKEFFVLSHWVINLLYMLAIVAFSLFVREAAHRIFGLMNGYKVEYLPSFHTLVLGMILAFISNGRIFFFLAPNTVKLEMLEKHRLGYFRYGLSYGNVGTVSLMGPLASILLAVLFKVFTFLPSSLIERAVIINVALAVSNMLPIPGLDGMQMFFASRAAYIFAVGAILGMSIFLLVPRFSLMISLLGALILGGIFCLGYFGFLEQRVAGQ